MQTSEPAPEVCGRDVDSIPPLEDEMWQEVLEDSAVDFMVELRKECAAVDPKTDTWASEDSEISAAAIAEVSQHVQSSCEDKGLKVSIQSQSPAEAFNERPSTPETNWSTLPSLAEMSRAETIKACYVDPEVLRAVKARKCLWKFGSLLRSNAGSMNTYSISESVEEISSFWSHSWRANSTHKIVALCFHYNGSAAAIASLVAALIVVVSVKFHYLPGQECIISSCSTHSMCGSGTYCSARPGSRRAWGLQPACFVDHSCCSENMTNSIDKQCPSGCPSGSKRELMWWPMIVGVAVHFAVLFFKQPSDLVFLDKVCIHQTDLEKKQKGIDGLGGFLKRSKNVLVLWDASYFTRLWCTLEMAAALNLSGSRIIFKPVLRGYSLVLLMYLLSLYRLLDMMALIYAPSQFWYLLLVEVPVQLGTIWWTVHIGRIYSRDRSALHSQLGCFRCEDTQCFCCTVNHKLPGTDTPISCDRQAIYLALKCWFKGGLAELETKVHEMQPKVEAGLGSTLLSYGDLLYLLLPTTWWLLSKLAAEACGTFADLLFLVVVAVGLFSLDLLYIGCGVRVARELQAKSQRCCDWGVSLLAALILSVFFFVWGEVWQALIGSASYVLVALHNIVSLVIFWLAMTGANQIRRQSGRRCRKCCRRCCRRPETKGTNKVPGDGMNALPEG